MRKNKMMRAASGLLVAVLLTTCVISGTFAKYVTTGTGQDTARVAKWGVTVTAHGETFKQTYAKDDSKFTLEDNTVVSTEDVVAPGTSGEMESMELSGKPEVAVRVNYEGTFDIGENWKVGQDYYCPLEIKVNDDTIKGKDYSSAEAFEAAVKEKIDAYTKDYKAGTDLSTIKDDSLKITWNWAYTGNDDEKDTALGNAEQAGTVKLSVKTTVSQID